MLLLELDGQALDLSDFATNGIYVAKVDIGAPAVREVVSDLPDRSGTLDQTAHVGGRLITLSGQIIASATAGTRQEIMARLTRYCYPGSRPTLTVALNDDDPRRIGLRPDQFAAPIDRPGRCPFAASWKAPDPRFYDVTAHTVTTYPPVSAAQGREYNLVFPRVYPAGWGGSGYTTILVAGDFPTWPTHKLYGPATNPTIRVLGPGSVETSRVAFNTLTLDNNDYLEIDTQARAVWLNGDRTADRYSTLDVTRTKWGPLVPGYQSVVLSATAFGEPCQLETTWNDAFY